MNLLCIAVDHLHAGYLGCYGNTWIATPAFDQLAASGFVFDQATVDTLDLSAAYESWWRGTHVIEQRSKDSPGLTLAGLARQAGMRTLLAADDPLVLEHAAGVDFDEIVECLPTAGGDTAADDVTQTHTARLFAEAGDRLLDLPRPFAMWLHVGALGGAWDAPLSFRERYLGEDDPPVPTFTTLPERIAPPEIDLDERFGYSQAYAGQVTLLDTCLGALLEQLEETNLAGDTIVVVCGLRGLSLGEHGRVGRTDRRLYAENTHVPWLVRMPDRRGALRRSQALVQPSDLLPTVAEWLNHPLEAAPHWGRSLAKHAAGDAEKIRDRAIAVGAGEFAIRTTRWLLRGADCKADAEPTLTELFAKPDDFWEVSDVADRCPEVVEALQESYTATHVALAEGRDPPPLPAADEMLEA